jgi:SAM-dependent methyltransferase
MIFPESCKKYIDLQCNGDLSLYTDFPEIKSLDSYLKDMKPKQVADLGSGIGRATVFFEMKYKWNAKYYLIDGNSGDYQYEGIREGINEGINEFYNSHQATKDFCEANGICKLHVIHPDYPWYNLKYDLIYSFLAFGFHWPIRMVMDQIEKATTKDSLVIFGLRGSEERDWQNRQVTGLNKSIWNIEEYFLTPKLDRTSILILRRKG